MSFVHSSVVQLSVVVSELCSEENLAVEVSCITVRCFDSCALSFVDEAGEFTIWKPEYSLFEEFLRVIPFTIFNIYTKMKQMWFIT